MPGAAEGGMGGAGSLRIVITYLYYRAADTGLQLNDQAACVVAQRSRTSDTHITVCGTIAGCPLLITAGYLQVVVFAIQVAVHSEGFIFTLSTTCCCELSAKARV
jgi:hypothetical protein